MKKNLYTPGINPARVALPVQSGGSGEITRDAAVKSLALVSKTDYGRPFGHVRLGSTGKVVESQLPDSVKLYGPRLVIPDYMASKVSTQIQILGCDMLTNITVSSSTLTWAVDKEKMILTIVAPTSTTHNLMFCGKSYDLNFSDGKPVTPTLSNIWRNDEGLRCLAYSPYAHIGPWVDYASMQTSGHRDLNDLAGYVQDVTPLQEARGSGIIKLDNDYPYEYVRLRFRSKNGTYGDWSDLIRLKEPRTFAQKLTFEGEVVSFVSFSPDENYMLVVTYPVGGSSTDLTDRVYKVDPVAGDYYLLLKDKMGGATFGAIDNRGRVIRPEIRSGGANGVRLVVGDSSDGKNYQFSYYTVSVDGNPVGFSNVPMITKNGRTYVVGALLPGNKIAAYYLDLDNMLPSIAISNFALGTANLVRAVGVNPELTQVYFQFQNGNIAFCLKSGTVLSLNGGIANSGTSSTNALQTGTVTEDNFNNSFLCEGYMFRGFNEPSEIAALAYCNPTGAGYISIGNLPKPPLASNTGFGDSAAISRSGRRLAVVSTKYLTKWNPYLTLVTETIGSTAASSASWLYNRIVSLRQIFGNSTVTNNETYDVVSGQDRVAVICNDAKVNAVSKPAEIRILKFIVGDRYTLNQTITGASQSDSYPRHEAIKGNYPKNKISPNGLVLIYAEPAYYSLAGYQIGRLFIYERLTLDSPWVRVGQFDGIPISGYQSTQLGVHLGFLDNDLIYVTSWFYTQNFNNDSYANTIYKNGSTWTRSAPMKVNGTNRANVGTFGSVNSKGKIIQGPYMGLRNVDWTTGLFDFEILTPTAFNKSTTGAPFTFTTQVVSVKKPPYYYPEMGARGAIDDSFKWVALSDRDYGDIFLWDLTNPTKDPINICTATGRWPAEKTVTGLQEPDIAMSSDGRIIAAAYSGFVKSNGNWAGYIDIYVNDNGTVRYVQSITGSELIRTNNPAMGATSATCLDITPSGSHLIFTDREGIVILERSVDDTFTPIDKIVTENTNMVLPGTVTIHEATGDIMEHFRGINITTTVVATTRELQTYKRPKP